MGVTAPRSFRLSEVLVALSPATDLGSGFPLGKGLRTCLVATSAWTGPASTAAAQARGSTPAAGILAAADVFHALGEERPHRPARSRDVAARELDALVAGGGSAATRCSRRPDSRQPRCAWPGDLTDHEVDVPRLTVRGLTNRPIGAELVISARTVQAHLARIYDKTGRRTRAGAAVYAIEHGLVVPSADGSAVWPMSGRRALAHALGYGRPPDPPSSARSRSPAE